MTNTTKAYDYRSPEYIREMRDYVRSLKQASGDHAAREARESLIRTGIADKNGHVKKQIVFDGC